MPLLGLAAVSSPAIERPLLARLSSASLGLLLVAMLLFSLLLFYEVLYPFAVLEIVALGAVDLTVLLVGVVLLVGGCHSLAVGARGSLLAGATNLGFLGASLLAGLLDD